MSKNTKRFLLLLALGIAYGFMYVMPYMKSSFYDQMIAAMGCTNAQLGSLMTYYAVACTVSYLPGGWIGDKFSPKPVLLVSIFGQAALSFLFMFTYQSYTMAVIIWLLMGLTGGFAFWPAMMKGIRMTGSDEEQGRIYGIFEALNGLASLLLSFIMIGIMAVVSSTDLVKGFKDALLCMGLLSLVSGILVLLLMPKDAEFGANVDQKAERQSFNMKDYISAFKIPGIWVMAILVWCYVTISAVASYLTPYSTNVLGMSAVTAASIGTLRTYGCRLIGGPLGGVLADNVFKSVSKEQVLGQLSCLVTLGLFLVLPNGTSSTLLAVLLLLVGVAMFLCKGTYFSIQAELGISTKISATAVAIATLIMLMLALRKRLPYLQRRVNLEKVWETASLETLGIKGIWGQTIGLVGLGKIGKAVAQRAAAFGMEVIAYDPFIPDSDFEKVGARKVELDYLLENSDVVSSHMDLNDTNVNFFGDAEFDKMKKKPIFLNVSRGGEVDEGALLRALDTGKILAAGLDVLVSESPNLEECPFIGREDCIVTPHSAFYSDDSIEACERISVMNAIYYINGEYDKVFKLVQDPRN